LLGRLDIQFQDNKLVEKRWRLLDVTNDVPESSTVRDLVDQARAPFLAASVNMPYPMPGIPITLAQPINTVVGNVSAGLDRRGALANSFNIAYSDMLRRYTASQVAITPGFRFDAVIPSDAINYEDPAVVAGEVTVEDAYRFFPVPFFLSSATVTGKRLKEVIESNLTAVFSPNTFNHSGGWFDAFSGLQLTVDLANSDGSRINDIRASDSGVTINDTDVLTVSGCTRPYDFSGDTTICGYEGFNNVTAITNPSTQQSWSGVDFLIYGLEHQLLQARLPTG